MAYKRQKSSCYNEKKYCLEKWIQLALAKIEQLNPTPVGDRLYIKGF